MKIAKYDGCAKQHVYVELATGEWVKKCMISRRVNIITADNSIMIMIKCNNLCQ